MPDPNISGHDNLHRPKVHRTAKQGQSDYHRWDNFLHEGPAEIPHSRAGTKVPRVHIQEQPSKTALRKRSVIVVNRVAPYSIN